MKKVSLKDIADKAGVSTALVSFVLNDKGKEHRVGEQTAKHILKIAREMNYQPNMAAKSLRSGKTGTIGVVVSDISNPFFSQISRFIEDEAAKTGYTVLFGSSDEDAEKMHTIVSSLINKGVDGLIIVPCEKSSSIIETLIKNNTPIVLLDRPITDINASYVALDNFSATYKATTHLINNGYRSPGMVAYDIALSHMKERIRGYKKAMTDNGLKEAINVGILKHNAPRKGADKVVPKMIESGTDALVFATNTISLACLYTVKEMGITVPQQLGLMGFDGSDAFEFFYAPLSYIKQPIGVLAQKAVSILTEVIENKNKSTQCILVDGELTIRDSSTR